MELALYVVFSRVLCILRKFLKSFDPEALPEYEQGLIMKSRKIFVVVSINIGILMFTNSMFSLLSPFLWIGDVFYSQQDLMLVFTVSVQMFYLTNMLFSLVIVYAMHHFARYDKESDTLDGGID